MRRLALFTLLLLGGCYATATPMFLPDGSSGFHVTCGNYIGETADCIEKAGEVCGASGYRLYDQNGRPLSDEDQTRTVIAALNSNGSKRTSRSSDNQQSMFVKCKAPPPIVIEAPIPVENKPLPPVATPAPSTPAQGMKTAPPPPPSKPPVPDSSGPIPLQPD